MSSDQDTRGFLPPTNSGELHRQPPPSTTTLTGNNRHHLPHFTKIKVPPSIITTLDSHFAAALGRAIFTIASTSFRDSVPPSATVHTATPISPTVTDVTTSPDQEHTTTTSTPPKAREPPRRNPLRRTLSDIISPVRKTTIPSSKENKSPQSKRLRRTEETVTEIKQTCSEIGVKSGVTKEGVKDDNPSEAIVEQDKEEVRDEFVAFKRLDDGSSSIKLSCSCGNCFEFLRNRIGCYYKIDIASIQPVKK